MLDCEFLGMHFPAAWANNCEGAWRCSVEASSVKQAGAEALRRPECSRPLSVRTALRCVQNLGLTKERP
eukprot:5415537-Alexandrium_andersonii.AAC.1